jgi:hypothetical protein
MTWHFRKHYTIEEARALLPQVRKWLQRLNQLRGELEKQETRLEGLMAPGCDLGGSLVNTWVRTLADTKEAFLEFHRRDIQLKDPVRGLLDFPAIIGGREVFLCWEQDEDDIEFWHDLDTGYAGRERL